MADQHTDLKHILQHISALSHLPEPASLKRLIDALRVSDDDETLINDKISELITLLKQNPDYGQGLAIFILHLLDKYKQMLLYADAGIVSDDSFGYSFRRLIGHRFLPLLPEDDSVIELVHYLFDQPTDEDWLRLISGENWESLFDLIAVDGKTRPYVAVSKNGILNALVLLSYRISGVGLHPEMMKSYPPMIISAVFAAQNQEAVQFVENYRKAHELDHMTDVRPEVDIDTAPLAVMLQQCQDIVNNIRKRVYKTGISIRMTNMLLRLEQSIHRMELLLALLSNKKDTRHKALNELLFITIHTANTRYSFQSLIQSNTKLLSRKVTENASRVGEHYISTDRAGYQRMYKRAALGGLFIGCMATLKTLAYELKVALIGRAFVNSMIYGLGFATIHVVGGTVATKQPAMTAAAIASTISDTNPKNTPKNSLTKKNKQLTKLAELVVDILRTQFVAILGNMSVAMPVAFIVAYSWGLYKGAPMIDSKMAAHLLHDLDPLHSLSLIHAGIAGVYLFLSGLISGYYDNLATHNQIGARLKRHALLKLALPKAWLEKFANFTEANLGAIMGNFIFGCFLGSTATIGYILGLPLDIRHIAFASANLVHGLYFLSPYDFSIGLALYSLLGVLLIGAVNLIVSFSLSLTVALRAREVRFSQSKELLGLIFKHFITHPLNFIIPRTQSVKYETLDTDGRIIYEDNTIKEAALPHQYVVRRLTRRDKLDLLATAKTDLSQEQFKPLDTPTDDNKSADTEDNPKGSLPKPEKPPQLPK